AELFAPRRAARGRLRARQEPRDGARRGALPPLRRPPRPRLPGRPGAGRRAILHQLAGAEEDELNALRSPQGWNFFSTSCQYSRPASCMNSSLVIASFWSSLRPARRSEMARRMAHAARKMMLVG